MADHNYCRALLKEVMVEVREKFTAEEIKSAWAWDASGGRANQFEFHGPNDHYDHDVKGPVDCKWSALANGWERLMRPVVVEPEPEPEGKPMRCDQCQMLSINGVPCHETGCPNANARYDADTETWVKQRKCFDCGCTVDADDPCCSAPLTDEPEDDDDDEEEEDDDDTAGEECNGDQCDARVLPEDPYFATPCGTFCSSCMHEHMKFCGTCAAEFN